MILMIAVMPHHDHETVISTNFPVYDPNHTHLPTLKGKGKQLTVLSKYIHAH